MFFDFNQDAAMNKTTRNLSELQVRDVGVRADFTANVPRARRELSTLNHYRTPLEKLHCLRRTIMAISQPGYRIKTPGKECTLFLTLQNSYDLCYYIVLSLKYGVNLLNASVSCVLCQNVRAIMTATGIV